MDETAELPIFRQRNRYSAAQWAGAKAAYLGGATAPAVCAHYGVKEGAFRARAAREGWSKTKAAEAAPAPEPLPSGYLAPKPAESSGVRMRARPVRLSTKIWALAKDAYLGGATAKAVCGWYGMSIWALRARARRERWTDDLPPEPEPRPMPPEAYAPDFVFPEPPPEPLPVSDWPRIAHKAQRPPPGRWATWLFQGGRGAGKTRAGAEWLAARATDLEREGPRRFALVGATLHDVREVMIEGPSGLMNLPDRERPRFEASRRRLVWEASGAVAYCFSAEEPERLRGPQFAGAWADEFCAWPRPDETLALLRMGLRLGPDPRLVVTTTPKPLAALRRLRAEKSCVRTTAATSVNAANLSPAFLEGLEALYGGTRLAAQELEGLLVEGPARALWRAADLEAARGPAPPRLDRVVVAVDPPAGASSSDRGGSACGIVVAGRREGRAFVLADHTVEHLSPGGWARRVAEAADLYGAGEIVAEANQGGQMVRSTLVAAGVRCAVRLVHAREGKRARAEPIAALYEQGRVTHTRAFPQLEEEMMALGAEGGEGRNDRVDALVWALTALMLEGGERQPRLRVLDFR